LLERVTDVTMAAKKIATIELKKPVKLIQGWMFVKASSYIIHL
jgi:hypothetical protein